MPTTILKFKLPEESTELELAQKGPAYSIALEEIQNHLRNMVKYEDRNVVDIEELRTFIFDLRKELDI